MKNFAFLLPVMLLTLIDLAHANNEGKEQKPDPDKEAFQVNLGAKEALRRRRAQLEKEKDKDFQLPPLGEDSEDPSVPHYSETQQSKGPGRKYPGNIRDEYSEGLLNINSPNNFRAKYSGKHEWDAENVSDDSENPSIHGPKDFRATYSTKNEIKKQDEFKGGFDDLLSGYTDIYSRKSGSNKSAYLATNKKTNERVILFKFDLKEVEDRDTKKYIGTYDEERFQQVRYNFNNRKKAYEHELRLFEKLHQDPIEGLVEVRSFEKNDSAAVVTVKLYQGNLLSFWDPALFLPAKEVISIGKQVCDTSERMAEKGLSHGDIKLQNLLYERTPQGKLLVRLTDFGTYSEKTDQMTYEQFSKSFQTTSQVNKVYQTAKLHNEVESNLAQELDSLLRLDPKHQSIDPTNECRGLYDLLGKENTTLAKNVSTVLSDAKFAADRRQDLAQLGLALIRLSAGRAGLPLDPPLLYLNEKQLGKIIDNTIKELTLPARVKGLTENSILSIKTGLKEFLSCTLTAENCDLKKACSALPTIE